MIDFLEKNKTLKLEVEDEVAKITYIMKAIAESVELCRLCGHESEDVRSIFENPDLIKDLMFYLPLEVS